jgi:hypothetical protein
MKKEVGALFLKEFTKYLILSSYRERNVILPYHPVKERTIHFHPMGIMPVSYQQSIMRAASIPAPEKQQAAQETVAPENKPGTMQGLQPSMFSTSGFDNQSQKSGEQIAETQQTVSKVLPQKQQIAVQTPQSYPPFHPQQFPPRQQFRPMLKQLQKIQVPVNPHIQAITPTPQPLPLGFTLGNLDPLILDNTITNIECPGPGKFLLVRSFGSASITKINLNEKEIREIIEKFSQYAKIPLIGGLFKAAVGNLVMTAVVSDFVGSRFIINKYTPYSMLDAQKRRISPPRF